MKISKKKLLEIVIQECGMAMNDQPGMVNGEIDQEGRMAKQQLSDIAQYSQELSEMLQDETQLEAWVQDKLSKAADYIKTIKHYVQYGMEEGAYDQVSAQNEPKMMKNAPVGVQMAPKMPNSDMEAMSFEYNPEDFEGFEGKMDDFDDEY